MSKRKTPVPLSDAAGDDPQKIAQAEELEETGHSTVKELAAAEDDFEPDSEVEAGGGPGGVSALEVSDALLAVVADDYRYLIDRKVAFMFRNGKWETDPGDKHNLTHHLLCLACDLCRATYVQTGKKHLLSAHFPKAVVSITLPRLIHVIFAEIFDADPDLFGLPGGKVRELKTGVTRDAIPADYLSKSASVTPDAAIAPTRFLKFLDEITQNNPELVKYLLRLCGHFTCGQMTEEILSFWTGIGGNGKSILVDLLTKTLGDYVAIVSVKLLSASLREDSEQELRTMSHLAGARVAFASESSKRLKIDIGLIKKLTAPEKLVGRHLYEDSFEFRPSHKLVISAQAIEFEAVDFAVQRRLHVVEFPQKFVRPEDLADYPGALLIDKNIGRDLDAERPGILALLLNEARAWYSDGLTKPEIVRKTSAAFFVDADSYGQWLAECVVRDSAAFTTNNLWYVSYTSFMESLGREPEAKDVLSKKLAASGFENKQRSAGRGHIGFRIKERSESGDNDN
jgi:P4 family phage/plasmid primase-like protien